MLGKSLMGRVDNTHVFYALALSTALTSKGKFKRAVQKRERITQRAYP
jgi:hypothetical protein